MQKEIHDLKIGRVMFYGCLVLYAFVVFYMVVCGFIVFLANVCVIEYLSPYSKALGLGMNSCFQLCPLDHLKVNVSF